MVLHVPVEKRWQQTAGVSAAATSEVGRIWRKSDVLRHSTDHHRPARIKSATIEHQNEKPVPGRIEKCGQRKVAEHDDPGPVTVLTP